MFSNHRSKRALTRLLLLLVLAATVVLPSSPAFANAAFMTDCDLNPTEHYFNNQAVCVTGDMDFVAPGHFVPTADIYVTVNRAWLSGDRATDVSWGGSNRIQSAGGTFYDEFVWLPTLDAGEYDLLVDEDLNGRYNPSTDILLGAGLESAFTVDARDLAGYSIDVAAIKSDAAKQRDEWQDLKNAWLGVDLAQSVATGYQGYKFLRKINVGLKASFALSGTGTVVLNEANVPTDYNGSVFIIGGKIITSLTGSQVKHYDDLFRDPADPNYAVPVVLDLARVNSQAAPELDAVGIGDRYPLVAKGSGSDEAHAVELANLVAEQASLVRAVMQSNERFLGARDVDDLNWTRLQARSLELYAAELATSLDDTRVALQQLRLDASAKPGAATIIDAGALSALQSRLASSGFTTDEIRTYRNNGVSNEDAELWRTQFVAETLPDEDFSFLSMIDQLVAVADAYEPVVDQLVSNARMTKQAIESQLGGNAAPLAAAGGPYVGSAGSAVTVSASTTTGGTAPLTYKWDFDLDGSFDDATGVSATFTLDRPMDTLIGVEVRDARGLVGVDYAPLSVTTANGPPSISSTMPAAGAVEVTPGDSVAFTVTATDPDGDALSYEWAVDGAVVSTSATYTLSTSASSLGSLMVAVRVSDSDSFSRDTFEMWHVFVRHPDADGDGWRANSDCDDSDPTVNPGQEEVLLNGKDDDCEPETLDILK